MTWSIRIYPLERDAFLKALAAHEIVASAEEIKQAEAAKDLVSDTVHGDLLWSVEPNDDDALYDCSLVGHLSAGAASISINVYRRPAETPPSPEAGVEETARLQADLPEEVEREEG